VGPDSSRAPVRFTAVGSRFVRSLGPALVGLVTMTMLLIAAVTLIFQLGVQPVLSGSMRPDFGPGSVIITRLIPTSDLRAGDVVVFTPPDQHAQFAHRVVTVSGPAGDQVITTKGDANQAIDPWHAHLLASRVPVVVFSIPWIGNILEHVHGAALEVALIIVTGLLVCLLGVRSILGPRPGVARRRGVALRLDRQS
jgi:signal peptidase I